MLNELTSNDSHTPFDPEVNWDQSAVTSEQRKQLQALTREFSDCFVNLNDKQLGLTDKTTCKIETFPNTKPSYKLPYRSSPIMRQEMDKIVNQQLQQGLIEEADDGAWASPALLVKKASGGYRLVIDYRALNAATIPQSLRIPRLDEVLDCVGETKPKFFSVLDCTQGFHQIPLHPDSRDKTAFITPSGKYRYKTMPQGIKNAPMIFQALIDSLLRNIQYKIVMAYIDDICVFSPTFEKHLQDLREVFERFRQAKLKFHPKKCKFAVTKVAYLGHVLQPEGVLPSESKIEAIKSYPVPSKIKQVRGFLGLTGSTGGL